MSAGAVHKSENTEESRIEAGSNLSHVNNVSGFFRTMMDLLMGKHYIGSLFVDQ